MRYILTIMSAHHVSKKAKVGIYPNDPNSVTESPYKVQVAPAMSCRVFPAFKGALSISVSLNL